MRWAIWLRRCWAALRWARRECRCCWRKGFPRRRLVLPLALIAIRMRWLTVIAPRQPKNTALSTACWKAGCNLPSAASVSWAELLGRQWVKQWGWAMPSIKSTMLPTPWPVPKGWGHCSRPCSRLAAMRAEWVQRGLRNGCRQWQTPLSAIIFLMRTIIFHPLARKGSMQHCWAL